MIELSCDDYKIQVAKMLKKYVKNWAHYTKTQQPWLRHFAKF